MGVAENEAIIRNAFKVSGANIRTKIEAAMIVVLEAAVKYALELHDEQHQRHLQMGDTYGWALFRDGRLIKSEVKTNGNNVGDVRKSLKDAAKLYKGRGKGYTGIVMAGMHPGTYFKLDYEMDILLSTAPITRDRFKQLLIPINKA